MDNNAPTTPPPPPTQYVIRGSKNVIGNLRFYRFASVRVEDRHAYVDYIYNGVEEVREATVYPTELEATRVALAMANFHHGSYWFEVLEREEGKRLGCLPRIEAEHFHELRKKHGRTDLEEAYMYLLERLRGDQREEREV